MKTNKQFIDDIYEKYDEYTKEKLEQKQLNTRKFINMAAVVIVLISSLIVFSENEFQQQNLQQLEDAETNQITENIINLETVGSFENFYDVIKSKYNSSEHRDYYSTNEMKDFAVSESATNSVQSKTNTQVQNVDESDIVKVDNRYIYYVSDGKIVIIDAQNGATSSKIAEIKYEEFNPREIYVKNNKLIVIGNEYGHYTATCKVGTESIATYDLAGPANHKSGMILYDISNINEPKEIRRVMVQGSYISSRMIKNNIYFVANQHLYTSVIARSELKDLNEEDYKPKYQDTAISEEEKCIDYNRIYSLDSQDTSYLMLAGLNIESDEEADIKTFLGAGQYVYASDKNMYIAVNKQKYGEGYELLGGTTHLLKFGLEDGKFAFKANTDVEGQVNNQFSMDENGEFFRIATTSGNLWNITQDTKNNLYVLNDNLEEVGKITGFAPDEKIYSVRYVEEKAYVVTFKQTDPLFVIDLSNPSNPQILGELKLPGYSTYLHPYDETHLIGFGYETKETRSGVTTEGLKMVMFDISDFTNPQVLFKVNIGDRYTSSELLYNHKALLYSKEKNIIAFPLNSYRNGYSKAVIYEIDLEKGFIQKGEIANNANEYLKQVERIVFVNDCYYTLSKKLVKATDMESLEAVKEIEL